MPIGIDSSATGYLVFCTVKLVGYSFAAFCISQAYGRADRNGFLVGAARTLIGMAAGAVYYKAWALLPDPGPAGSLFYLGGLLPIRFAEWWLLLWLFYDRPLQQRRKGWCTGLLATLWSYALDVPAILGYVFAGGLWVC